MTSLCFWFNRADPERWPGHTKLAQIAQSILGTAEGLAKEITEFLGVWVACSCELKQKTCHSYFEITRTSPVSRNLDECAALEE